MKTIYQYNTWQFVLIFHSRQVIFIHHKLRIVTAIRDLQWMKMTMVNSGLNWLKHGYFTVILPGYLSSRAERVTSQVVNMLNRLSPVNGIQL